MKKIISVILTCATMVTLCMSALAVDADHDYYVKIHPMTYEEQVAVFEPLLRADSFDSSVLLQRNVVTNPTIDTYETELIQQMNVLGFSQEEVNTILQLEEERLQKLSSGITPYGFPSNPKEGDWHYETFDIHLSTISVTVSGIAGALIAKGVGATLAIIAANAIMNEIIEDSGYEAIKVTMSYRYGMTNDGVPGWSYGPVTWELI